MEGSSDFKLDLASDRGPGQKEEIRKVEGSSDFKLVWLQERGPSQNKETKKWKDPLSFGWLQASVPTSLCGRLICFPEIVTNR